MQVRRVRMNPDMWRLSRDHAEILAFVDHDVKSLAVQQRRAIGAFLHTERRRPGVVAGDWS
jgi:hypothetical protein